MYTNILRKVCKNKRVIVAVHSIVMLRSMMSHDRGSKEKTQLGKSLFFVKTLDPIRCYGAKKYKKMKWRKKKHKRVRPTLVLTQEVINVALFSNLSHALVLLLLPFLFVLSSSPSRPPLASSLFLPPLLLDVVCRSLNPLTSLSHDPNHPRMLFVLLVQYILRTILLPLSTVNVLSKFAVLSRWKSFSAVASSVVFFFTLLVQSTHN